MLADADEKAGDYSGAIANLKYYSFASPQASDESRVRSNIADLQRLQTAAEEQRKLALLQKQENEKKARARREADDAARREAELHQNAEPGRPIQEQPTHDCAHECKVLYTTARDTSFKVVVRLQRDRKVEFVMVDTQHQDTDGSRCSCYYPFVCFVGPDPPGDVTHGDSDCAFGEENFQVGTTLQVHWEPGKDPTALLPDGRTAPILGNWDAWYCDPGESETVTGCVRR
jgi:hypothetical protein